MYEKTESVVLIEPNIAYRISITVHNKRQHLSVVVLCRPCGLRWRISAISVVF